MATQNSVVRKAGSLMVARKQGEWCKGARDKYVFLGGICYFSPCCSKTSDNVEGQKFILAHGLEVQSLLAQREARGGAGA